MVFGCSLASSYSGVSSPLWLEKYLNLHPSQIHVRLAYLFLILTQSNVGYSNLYCRHRENFQTAIFSFLGQNLKIPAAKF